MDSTRGELIIVAGSGFLRAYSGTLYLARALQEQGFQVTVLVPAAQAEVAQYESLDVSVTCLVRPSGSWIGRKVVKLIQRLKILFTLLRADRAIVTENMFFREASIAKKLRGRALTMGHFCQELLLECDYPEIPHIRGIMKWSRVPDFVIDVEPNRARVRQEKCGLAELPFVLWNTLPRSGMPPRGEVGGLTELAGVEFPPGVPVLVHMGGVGREKPLERVIDAVAHSASKVFFLAFCSASDEKLSELRAYAAERLPDDAFEILGPRRRDELLASAWEADIGIIDYSCVVEDTFNQRYCAPTKLYEFMALGLAVIGSNNDSLRDVVEREGIGCCAEGDSTEELGAALGRIAADKEALSAMGKRASSAFQERHCYEELCAPVIESIAHRLAARG